MATSNRDRVGGALERLAKGLGPYIDRVVGDDLPEGQDWTYLLAAKDKRKGANKEYSRTDVYLQLRVLTETVGKNWNPFDKYLSRTEKTLATELREIRNSWAHTEPFTSDDTYRALDSIERLLRVVGDAADADQVRGSRQALQREMYENEVRNKARSQVNPPSLESTGLPPWRDVLRPHPDVESGDYAASEFAADLYLVAKHEAAQEYSDPAEFYRRTYLTEGLRDLLTRSAARVAGDSNATPVINLQTNFGGGKTHSMLAVWHLFSGRPITDYPQEVQDTVGGHDLGGVGTVHRVAIVGNQVPTGRPTTKSDGTQVHTLWGELAWQLGGRKGYDMVAESDRTATNPGALDELFRTFGPAVILIDEWVAYARSLQSPHELCGGTFEMQFTFAQTLTESVKRVPGTLLLVSIPASDVYRDAEGESHDSSDLEIGGAYGREALHRLQNVVSRLAHQWRPASSQESFEIVRRRLFLEPGPDARTSIGITAKKFVEFYRQHRGEFPRDTGEVDYEKRIKDAYPIHPELFDRLYEDWSSLERFQRTRGVLRLMSGVVHALWESGDKSPLIMLGSVPLDALSVRDEIAAYLEDQWKPIIDADIDGENSVPLRIDQSSSLFGKRSLTRRIARSVFLGSAPRLHSAHKGIERQRVFLGVAQPGDTVGNFGSALQRLIDMATYFYADGDSYWFDLQQSLSRRARDQAEAFHDEDVWNAIVERLKSERNRPGHFAAVVVAPTSSAEVDDTDTARLVILHPKYLHSRRHPDSRAQTFVRELIEHRGSAQRERRNTIVALAPDNQRYDELASAVRTHLAWRHIVSRIGEMNLNQQQIAQAKRQHDDTSRAVDQRLPATYIWALYPEQPDGSRPLETAEQKIDGNGNHLAERTGTRLVADDALRIRTAYRNVRMDLDKYLRSRWNEGRISFGELWGYYARYPYLARLRDRQVLADAVRDVLGNMDVTWQSSGFALATGYDVEHGDFTGLAVPTEDEEFGPVTDSTLLVKPDLAQAQREREHEQPEPPVDGESGGDTNAGRAGGLAGRGKRSSAPPPAPEATRNARYEARVGIDATGDIESQLTTIVREVLIHLQRQDPEALDITLQVSAERLEGFADTAVRTVSENATTLDFAQSKFEDGA